MADLDPKLSDRRNRPTADDDYAAWIHHQVAALKTGRFEDLDIEDLAEEVESLAKRDFRALIGALRVILTHMLKWDYQSEERGSSWRRSINRARDDVWAELASSPSFKSRLPEAIGQAYRQARGKAHDETGIFLRNFPEECPYSWDEIMTRPHNLAPDVVPENKDDPFQGFADYD